jgi:hypothetical protein
MKTPCEECVWRDTSNVAPSLHIWATRIQYLLYRYMSRNRCRFHSVLVVFNTASSTLSKAPPRAAFSFRMRLRDSLLGLFSTVLMVVTCVQGRQ